MTANSSLLQSHLGGVLLHQILSRRIRNLFSSHDVLQTHFVSKFQSEDSKANFIEFSTDIIFSTFLVLTKLVLNHRFLHGFQFDSISEKI